MPDPPLAPPDGPPDSPGNGTPNRGAAAQKPQSRCGVRYGAMNWVGEFRAPPQTDLPCGSKVVIQSDRGIELGEQIRLTCPRAHVGVGREQIRRYIDNSGGEFYRFDAGKILRAASPQDCAEHERLNAHVHADVQLCAQKTEELKLDMKVITAEHLLGGERIVFYFRSEGRVDFRELVRALAQHYQTRIEMRQVGARDEARLIADYEVCGRECCCKNFLKKLRPITMRMAKLQKSTLDPSKVSGRCGRLRCCLRYEHEGYDELIRKLPRIGDTVGTESGPATVIDRQVLTQLVLVRGEDGRESCLPVAELLEPGATQPKVAKSTADSAAPGPDVTREPPSTEGPPERARRRRRSRKSPKAVNGEAERPATEPTPPAAPPPEAAPPKPPAEPSGPVERDQGQDKAAPRRRRRRRRSRRNRPDSGAGER